MTKEEILDKLFHAPCEHTDFGAIYNAMDEYAKCWRERCLAAEDYIAKSPGDPDITEAQIKAYEKWQRLVEADPEAKNECSEYAKQQAVEFVKWAIEGGKIMGDNWGDAFIPGSEDELYDQFIESQNK